MTTGTGIDTRVVQKLLKTHAPETVLNAILAMGDKKVDKPVAYLMGILRAKKRDSHVEQVKSDKFQAVIDMAREDGGELTLRSPFHEPSPA
jgi:predicted nucleotide-binding protein (sugar kinase/HSP70/actin superfamily)